MGKLPASLVNLSVHSPRMRDQARAGNHQIPSIVLYQRILLVPWLPHWGKRRFQRQSVTAATIQVSTTFCSLCPPEGHASARWLCKRRETRLGKRSKRFVLGKKLSTAFTLQESRWARRTTTVAL